MLQGPAPDCFWVFSGICVLWDFIFIIFYVLSLSNREISEKDFADQPAGAQGMWGCLGATLLTCGPAPGAKTLQP